MKTQKLETVDAFIVFDLDGADASIGVTRLAPKVLVDGATWLARSLTYQFATFELKIGGASAGINAPADGRDEAVRAFVAEVEPLVSAGRFLTEPAKGVDATDLEPLRALDMRSPHYWDEGPTLRALGVAVAAETALGSLDGRAVALEGFDQTGPALAAMLVERGARVVAIGTAKGTVLDAAGFTPDALAGAWTRSGAGLVAELGVEVAPPAAIFGAEVDALVVGSKTGVVGHEVATQVQARVVVPSGPLPVTAKALAVLGRADVVVLPDFVTVAGPLFAAFPPNGRTPAQLAETVIRRVSDSLTEVLGHADGPVLAACHRAEAFLATWRETLPFGRPLA